jgi:hypothetical protein
MTEDPYDHYPFPQNQEEGLKFKPNAAGLCMLLDAEMRSEHISQEVMQLIRIAINHVAKIPQIDPDIIRGLNRDWIDIKALSECVGTEKIVLEKEKKLLFEVAALGAYSGEPIVRISAQNPNFKELVELKKE